MKIKNLIGPGITFVSFVLVILSLFISYFSLETLLGATGVSVLENFGSGFENPAFTTISAVAIIVGAVALAAALTAWVAKIAGIKCNLLALITKVAGLVAAVAAVLVIVFGILFMTQNSSNLGTVAPSVGFFFAAIGLLVGAGATLLQDCTVCKKSQKRKK